MLEEHGPLEREELKRLVGGRYWGPGRFRAALRAATEEGKAVRQSRTIYGPPIRDGQPGPAPGAHRARGVHRVMIARRCPHCWRLADPVAPGNDRCPYCLAPLDRSEACAEVEDLVRRRLYGELHAGILSVEPRAAGPRANA